MRSALPFVLGTLTAAMISIGMGACASTSSPPAALVEDSATADTSTRDTDRCVLDPEDPVIYCGYPGGIPASADVMEEPPDGFVRCPPGYVCAGISTRPECQHPCDTSVSRRAFKTAIRYLDDAERELLARETLSMSLATYVYKSDPLAARRRLGFIIDDQPDPSFAVDDDRTHVDLYGYTSMLLATVQQQHKEIAELEKRVAALEAKH